MDNTTLLVGILGAACTIVAAFITPLIQRYFENQIFLPISRDRRKILEGAWRGTVTQELDNLITKEFSVDLSFNIKAKKVIGEGIINQDKISYVNLDGSFRNDRFLKMDYQNKNLNVVQFGCFVFHLSEDCTELTGRFVGYGHTSKAIIYGHCVFKKL